MVFLQHAGRHAADEDGDWHPNRYTTRTGAGVGLLRSRATRDAIRELEAHRHESVSLPPRSNIVSLDSFVVNNYSLVARPCMAQRPCSVALINL